MPKVSFFMSFRPITLFSLRDLRENKISFVHGGVPTSRLPLRVSDGEKVCSCTPDNLVKYKRLILIHCYILVLSY